MGGNYSWFTVTDVTVDDATVKAGESAELTVKFTCDGDLLAEWFRGDFTPALPTPPPPFDYEAKVYLEGMGSLVDVDVPVVNGTLVPNQADYEVTVTTPALPNEGIYEVTALVELGHNAGFVMGHWDGDLKISVWDAP